jgi:hypothetical protein
MLKRSRQNDHRGSICARQKLGLLSPWLKVRVRVESMERIHVRTVLPCSIA